MGSRFKRTAQLRNWEAACKSLNAMLSFYKNCCCSVHEWLNDINLHDAKSMSAVAEGRKQLPEMFSYSALYWQKAISAVV